MSASISHVQYLGPTEWRVYPFFASIFSKVQAHSTPHFFSCSRDCYLALRVKYKSP